MIITTDSIPEWTVSDLQQRHIIYAIQVLKGKRTYIHNLHLENIWGYGLHIESILTYINNVSTYKVGGHWPNYDYDAFGDAIYLKVSENTPSIHAYITNVNLKGYPYNENYTGFRYDLSRAGIGIEQLDKSTHELIEVYINNAYIYQYERAIHVENMNGDKFILKVNNTHIENTADIILSAINTTDKSIEFNNCRIYYLPITYSGSHGITFYKTTITPEKAKINNSRLYFQLDANLFVASVANSYVQLSRLVNSTTIFYNSHIDIIAENTYCSYGSKIKFIDCHITSNTPIFVTGSEVLVINSIINNQLKIENSSAIVKNSVFDFGNQTFTSIFSSIYNSKYAVLDTIIISDQTFTLSGNYKNVNIINPNDYSITSNA